MDVKDPVCGMDVEHDEAAGQSDFQGKTYYFCCNECKEKFDKNPQMYAKSARRRERAPAPERASRGVKSASSRPGSGRAARG